MIMHLFNCSAPFQVVTTQLIDLTVQVIAVLFTRVIYLVNTPARV